MCDYVMHLLLVVVDSRADNVSVVEEGIARG